MYLPPCLIRTRATTFLSCSLGFAHTYTPHFPCLVVLIAALFSRAHVRVALYLPLCLMIHARATTFLSCSLGFTHTYMPHFPYPVVLIAALISRAPHFLSCCSRAHVPVVLYLPPCLIHAHAPFLSCSSASRAHTRPPSHERKGGRMRTTQQSTQQGGGRGTCMCAQSQANKQEGRGTRADQYRAGRRHNARKRDANASA